MEGMKDLFSSHAHEYARYRPQYPAALLVYLANQVKYRGVAWDCACGNGQLALQLEEHFNLVCASDASAAQISAAPARSGIHYSVQVSEHTDYPDQFFDLVTVGQAIHWFNLPLFYKEVKRVLRPGGVLALIGYGLCRINKEIDPWIDFFYQEVVGPYWEPERRIIEEGYANLEFPFTGLSHPSFEMKESWGLSHFLGYLGTWSAVHKYSNVNQADPIEMHKHELMSIWKVGQTHEVQFPMLLKAGRQE